MRTKELLRKERQEAHLYMNVKVITPQTFRKYGGTDLAHFDADPKTDDSAPRHYRVKRTLVLEDFVAQIGQDMGENPKKLRLWVMVNRQNKTVRPDVPVLDLQPTVEDLYHRVNSHRDPALRLWVEVAEEVDAEGNGVFPAYNVSGGPAIIHKSDVILLFLKCFDLPAQTLHGVGQIYIGRDKKVDDITPHILRLMGWGDKVPSDERIFLWEVSLIQPPRPPYQALNYY